MSSPDAVPLPRLGEVFFDVRGSSRSMRLSWYSDSEVAVFSIWQGGVCTGTFRLAIDDLPRMVQVLSSGPGASQPETAGYPRTAGDPQATGHAAAAGYPETGYPPAGGYPAAAGYPETSGYPQRAGYPEAPGYPERAGFPETAGYSERAGYPETPGYTEPAGYRETAGYRGEPAADPAGYGERPGYPEAARYPETARHPETAGYRAGPSADPAGYPGRADYAGRAADAAPGSASGHHRADTAPTDGGYWAAERGRDAGGSRSHAGAAMGSASEQAGPADREGDHRAPAGYGAAGARGNGYPDGAYAAPGRPGNGYGTGRGPGNGDPAGHGRDGTHPAAGQPEISHFPTSQPAGYPQAAYPESSADGNHQARGLAWPAETAGTRYRPGGDSASQIRPNGYGGRAGAEGVPDADSFTYPQLAGSASGAEQHRDSRPDAP